MCIVSGSRGGGGCSDPPLLWASKTQGQGSGLHPAATLPPTHPPASVNTSLNSSHPVNLLTTLPVNLSAPIKEHLVEALSLSHLPVLVKFLLVSMTSFHPHWWLKWRSGSAQPSCYAPVDPLPVHSDVLPVNHGVLRFARLCSLYPSLAMMGEETIWSVLNPPPNPRGDDDTENYCPNVNCYLSQL